MPKVDIWSRLTPQSRQAVEISRAQYAAYTTTSTDPLRVAREGYLHERRYWNSFAVDVADVRDLEWPTTHGPVPLRLYRPSPATQLPVLVYSHGGGFTLGNLDSHDRICRLLAVKSGWAVLAVDYTLAPERKFPCQQEQVLQVVQELVSRGASLGIDGRRVALGGDSAGARLSLAATLDARAQGGPTPAALLLYYGAYGLRDSMSRRLYGWSDLDGMGDEDLNGYNQHQYANAADRDSPRSNLLANRMDGMPPTFIGGVSYDPLRDDSVVLAEYLKECAVPYRLRLYEGVLHSFLHYSAVEPLAMQAIEEGAAFLRELT